MTEEGGHFKTAAGVIAAVAVILACHGPAGNGLFLDLLGIIGGFGGIAAGAPCGAGHGHGLVILGIAGAVSGSGLFFGGLFIIAAEVPGAGIAGLCGLGLGRLAYRGLAVFGLGGLSGLVIDGLIALLAGLIGIDGTIGGTVNGLGLRLNGLGSGLGISGLGLGLNGLGSGLSVNGLRLGLDGGSGGCPAG